MPAPPDVLISIVNHENRDLVRACLLSLPAACDGIGWEATVIDNVSGDGSLEMLAREFPEVRVVANRVRMGFGANHNQAFGHCATPWFLVLNPDIRFDRDILAPLVGQARPDSGLLTPRILEPGKDEPEQHRAIITPHEILVRRRPGYQRPAVPHWIPGLFMLFRSDAYREVGGFDERFFMYGEDFDICARTQLAGWKLQVAEDLLARHDAQRASRTSHRHLYWHVTSLLKVWSSAAFWRYRRLVAGASGGTRGGQA